MIRLEAISKVYNPGSRAQSSLGQRVERTLRPGKGPRSSKPVQALSNVSLEVPKGTIYVVMGLSGSGKSTLLRCINMLSPPTSGKVFVGDVEMTTASPKTLRAMQGSQLAMVFQHFALLPHRTVLSNVAFGLELQR